MEPNGLACLHQYNVGIAIMYGGSNFFDIFVDHRHCRTEVLHGLFISSIVIGIHHHHSSLSPSISIHHHHSSSVFMISIHNNSYSSSRSSSSLWSLSSIIIPHHHRHSSPSPKFIIINLRHTSHHPNILLRIATTIISTDITINKLPHRPLQVKIHTLTIQHLPDPNGSLPRGKFVGRR